MPASLSAGAFIAAILVFLPLPSHWRAQNVAILALIAWLFVVDMIYGINSVVWSENVEVRLLVWCDITTKITIGVSSALPACTTCICKHLEFVASGRAVRLTSEDKRRRMLFELAMCFAVPMVLMALHYVVQGHRFDIVESVGCQPATYYSIPAVFIVWFPPLLLLSTITLIYASVALWHFFRQRINFATHLRDCSPSLTTSRYLRLIAMSIVEMLWGTSLTTLAMYDNISPGLRPWLNWDYVHSNFSRVGQYALVQCTAEYLQQLFLFYWAIPASSLIFFLFFGFGEETMKDYSKALTWIRRRTSGRQVNKSRSRVSSISISRPYAVKMASISAISTYIKYDETLPYYRPPTDGRSFPVSPAKTESSTGTVDTFVLSDIDLDDIYVITPNFSSVSSPSGYRSSMSRSPASPVSTIVLPSATHNRPLSTLAFSNAGRVGAAGRRRDSAPMRFNTGAINLA